jgi:hypothetical protein
MNGRRTMLEPEAVLVRLRTLARELNVPVVALYPLQQDATHPYTLTRQELNEAEGQAKCVNSILLLTKVKEALRFVRPKIATIGLP